MWVVWLVIAVICGLIWGGLTISSIMSGSKHHKRARELHEQGQWEDASLEYKLAIIDRLDSRPKLEELTGELAKLYSERGVETDFSMVLECPEVIKMLGADTREQKKKNELMIQTYTKVAEHLDTYPGPKIP